MRYYECKCGKMKCCTSMGFTMCARCNDCGTGYGGHEPSEHEYAKTEVRVDGGVGHLTVCLECNKTKDEIENEK